MIYDILDVPNTALSIVLVLMVRFTSAGFDMVQRMSLTFWPVAACALLLISTSMASQFMILSTNV